MTGKQERFIRDLYDEMYDTLMKYTIKVLGDTESAEDAVQEVLVLICMNVELLMHHEAPNGWVLLTMRNILRGAAKERVKGIKLLGRLQEKTLFEQDEESDYEQEIDPDVLYEDILESEDYKLMRRLAEGQLTISELASEMGISVEACKKRVQRARKRLEKYFRDIQ